MKTFRFTPLYILIYKRITLFCVCVHWDLNIVFYVGSPRQQTWNGHWTIIMNENDAEWKRGRIICRILKKLGALKPVPAPGTGATFLLLILPIICHYEVKLKHSHIKFISPFQLCPMLYVHILFSSEELKKSSLFSQPHLEHIFYFSSSENEQKIT